MNALDHCLTTTDIKGVATRLTRTSAQLTRCLAFGPSHYARLRSQLEDRGFLDPLRLFRPFTKLACVDRISALPFAVCTLCCGPRPELTYLKKREFKFYPGQDVVIGYLDPPDGNSPKQLIHNRFLAFIPPPLNQDKRLSSSPSHPLNLLSKAMQNSTFLPTFFHQPNNGSVSHPSSSAHYADRGGESNLEVGESPWALRSTFDARHPSQGPSALAEWETATLWTPDATGRLPQEAIGGIGMFDPASTIHASYSDVFLDQGTPEFFHPAFSQPVLPYPLSQVASRGVINNSPDGMERQSISLGYASSRRSAGNNPEDHLQLPTADAVRTVVYEANVAPVSSPPLPVHLHWRKIPQERYIPKMGDKSFLRLQGVTFSVNGTLGFNMKRALDQNFRGLDGRDRPVLEDANGPVSCRLLFSGYPADTQHNQIAVKNWKKTPAPITRSKLAYEIAKRINRYLDDLATAQMDPSADPRWTVGQGCMKIENMYLVSFTWVSKGSLQPEIWVDTACA
ncbi:hypothetical protein BJ322DRAFT_1109355 [Thelephora terrestris]|uniref:Uncharacterized protein n=1 Tax=Thelephora terrestris TaxID=56493 RepID=A0A9P6L6D6_9AGAM|nr:hypothetical protein BJ322DRAFT_1109355 [Thelephora terrestris]